MHRRTGGNPFFVEQTARLPDTAGPVAAGVRDAVERRLALLPTATVDLLRAAAVLGHEFEHDLLVAIAPTPDAGSWLEPALTTRLVAPTGPDRWAFTHDLVRERLAATLPDDDRRALHAAVVRALAARPGPPAPAATVAHHARLAVPRLPAADAVGHLLTAARDAGARQAAEEAVRHYRAALSLDDGGSAHVRLELATQLDQAGELDAAREACATVVAESRASGDAELLARAALGLHRLGNPGGEPGAEIALMDEARAGLARRPGAAPALTARVLAAAGMARTHQAVDADTALELSTQAVALARDHDDEALGWCLLAHHDAIWEPGSARARIAVLDELTAAARRARDRELEALSSFLRTVALLELGSPAFRTEFATFEALTARGRLPRHRYLALSRQGSLATLTGRFDDARVAIDDALAFGERVGEVDRMRVWRDQTWALELLRGHVSAAEEVARTSTPGDPYVGFLEGLTAAHRGDTGVALRRLADVERLARGLPRWFAPMWLVFQAQLAAATKDDELCARARTAIAPLAGGWAVLFGAGVVWGPMSLWAAIVDAAQERWDEAVTGFTAAVEDAELLDAGPWAVLGRAHLAEALLARGGAGDAEAAASALDRAVREAERLGMAAAVARFTHLGAEAERSAAAGPDNAFRFDGQVWTLRFAGRTVHVRDAKGLHDLRTLLGRPGTDVPAAELLDPTGDAALARSRALGADPVLDDRARSAYRARLQSLDGMIREALGRQDDRRAAALDREREALIDELRSATGLAGRGRRLGDVTERARQAVTARIRDSMRRLRDVHPELAEHLDTAVVTGASCSYRPPSPTPWSR